MCGLEIIMADHAMKYPRDGNWFIMQVLFEMGFPRNIFLRLNQVQVFMQVLFLSDILTAFGQKINPDILSCRPTGEAWLTMRWPNEHPTESGFHLWQ
jgi:hypothetical protein